MTGCADACLRVVLRGLAGTGLVIAMTASTAGALTFTTPSGSPVALSGIPTDVVTADFNGDHKADLAISEDGSNDVRILQGNGTGHFTQANGSPVSALSGVGTLAAGDINNDHKADLAAIVSGASYGWATLQRDAGGVWQRYIGSKSGYGAGGSNDLSMADFDRDGNVDYAFLQGPSADVLVVRGDGHGGTLPQNELGSGNGPYSGAELPTLQPDVAVLTGDFNGDGYPDIATVEADSGGAGSLEVWINNQAADNQAASGEFAAADFQTVGAPISLSSSPPQAAVSADFNHDGLPDFAVVNEDGSVSIVLADGDGGYSAAQTFYPLGRNAQANTIAVGDLNGDGQPDLIVGGLLSHYEMAFMLGRSDGGFSNGGWEQVTAEPNALAVADFNGDGKPDLAAVSSSSSNLTVLLNSSKPELSLAPAALKFATQARNTVSASKVLSVTNTGPVPITPGSIHVTGLAAGDFIVNASACRDLLLQHQSCALRVYFSPAAKGTRRATLRLSNDLWQHVTLTGTGG